MQTQELKTLSTLIIALLSIAFGVQAADTAAPATPTDAQLIASAMKAAPASVAEAATIGSAPGRIS